jgi:hypothetical protein
VKIGAAVVWRVPHRVFLLPLVVATAVGLAACSSPNLGTPNQSPTNDATPAPSPLASVDPCTLITQRMITSNQLEPGKTVNAPGGRACRWERPDDGAAIDGYVLQIVIYDKTGIDQLNTVGGTMADYAVDTYQGKLFQDTPLNACVVSLGTSANSRVDLTIVSRLGIEQGCALVKEVAPLAAANFPQ